jgi:hypothetical protein
MSVWKNVRQNINGDRMARLPRNTCDLRHISNNLFKAVPAGSNQLSVHRA